MVRDHTLALRPFHPHSPSMTMSSPRPMAHSPYFHPINADGPAARPAGDIIAEQSQHASNSDEFASQGGEHSV